MQEASSSAKPSNDVSESNPSSPDHQYCLDDFNLIRVIGRGTYAKVFMAELKQTSKIYAIKVIKKNPHKKERQTDRVQTEKLVLQTATCHPFLIGLHSCFQTISRTFFVMEMAQGGDFVRHLEIFVKLPEKHVQFYSAEIALALNFLHKNGIIYRDLKLDNLLLDRDGHIKLADYGLCKVGITGGVTTNSFCGTSYYMAPELIKGENYGHSVDWWALGIVMYTMVLGALPFRAPRGPDATREEHEDLLFNGILRAPVVVPLYVGAPAADIILGFLEKNPQDRLGCDSSGFSGVASHCFYRGIDWCSLENKKVIPPYIPYVNSDRDIDCFGPEFTKELVDFTPDEVGVLGQVENYQFEGFDYTNTSLLAV